MKDTKDTVNADVVTTRFSELITKLGGGSVEHDAGEQIEKVVRGVVATGKAGKITLTVDVSPLKGGVNQLMVEGSVKSKIPTKAHDANIFFPTKTGALTRKNPNQMDFLDKEDDE